MKKQFKNIFIKIKKTSSVFVALFLLLAATPSFAADCDFDSTPTTQIDALIQLSTYRAFCLGDASVDKSELTQAIDPILSNKTTAEEQFEAAKLALSLLVEYTENRAKTSDNKTDWNNLNIEIQSIAKALSSLSTKPSLSEYFVKVDQTFTPKWIYITNITAEESVAFPINGVKIYPFALLANCSAQDCSEYTEKIDMMRVFVLMKNIQSTATRYSLTLRLQK